MGEGKGFLEWVKYKWKVLSISDGHFFRFIWIVAISVSLLTVCISAGVINAGEKKQEKERIELEEKKKAEEAEAALASLNDAREKEKARIAKEKEWMLVLVNGNQGLPEDFKINEFTELVNDHKVDKRIYEELQKMFDDAREADQSPSITASYMSPEEAKEVGLACALDHTTGLSIDITSSEGEEDVDNMMKWFDENAAKYGFVIRYPEDKYSVTGVKGAKTHLRYVGKEAAAAMKEKGQCLEEYLESK
ncbi:LD-carboxypeptidase LdcB, LAS superfamily [Lachnospiraceae bacterium]|nr:LD-carboxypeptidase LdcB, LAS superfamily [Lachnospiraceae bacterium]